MAAIDIGLIAVYATYDAAGKLKCWKFMKNKKTRQLQYTNKNTYKNKINMYIPIFLLLFIVLLFVGLNFLKHKLK